MVKQEIEFKYLVNKVISKNNDSMIVQIYFARNGVEKLLMKIFNLDSLDNITTTRLRKVVHKGIEKWYLTLKTSGLLSRVEYETEVNGEILQILLLQPRISTIRKYRYVVNIDDLCFEFDEYLNLNTNLITCEIEVDNPSKEIVYKIENIFKKFNIVFYNVTDDPSFKNSNLIKKFGEKNEENYI